MISLFKVNERVGDSFRPVKRLKRANRRILWLKKGENFTFCSWGGGGGGLNKVLYGEALQNQNVSSTFSQAQKICYLLALSSLFTHGYDRFPYSFIYFNW